MGSMSIKIRIMPSFAETNLGKIKEKAKNLIEKYKGTGIRFEEEPIAFGLKALNIFFIFPENKELEVLENKIKEIENVNSAEVVDIRRTIE